MLTTITACTEINKNGMITNLNLYWFTTVLDFVGMCGTLAIIYKSFC